MSDLDLELFLPVHNEADSIEATIRELYAELSRELRVGFIICEDGSTDDTKTILQRLAAELPLRLNFSDSRRGYSRAVRDGMEMLEAEYLLCLDSDGQCDPKDFWQFWKARQAADLVMGWRTDRRDTFLRKLFSRFFYLIYEAVFHIPVHDPSCPYMLMPTSTVIAIRKQLGAMQQGFWWEFVARVHENGLSIRELTGTSSSADGRRHPGLQMEQDARYLREAPGRTPEHSHGFTQGGAPQNKRFTPVHQLKTTGSHIELELFCLFSSDLFLVAPWAVAKCSQASPLPYLQWLAYLFFRSCFHPLILRFPVLTQRDSIIDSPPWLPRWRVYSLCAGRDALSPSSCPSKRRTAIRSTAQSC